ncbi:peptidyl-tRNA hydrolase [Nerophis lumbriciformis]|uniref:peptidyl-tRNA hydrolase n=1 Tax=Nerophis lumbriciformis TaxID=546530 RepID=UPI002ADFA994|nr:probable peptidyl-tRNA hydrolase [Nerophis lumbriciformis]
MISDIFVSLCAVLSWHFGKIIRCFCAMQRYLAGIVGRVRLRESLAAVRMSSEAQVRCKLVVGLGNPGMESTRHSVGMAVLAALAARLSPGERWRGDKQVCGDVMVAEVRGARLVLLRPKVLMNMNGVSVAKAARKYGIQAEDIVLVHDELDKSLGKMSIKHGGSARGHNGVRSCVACLHADVMLRLRVGIGRPVGRMSVERHVLGRFTAEEQKVLDTVLVQSVDMLLSQLSQEDQGQSSASPAGGRHGAL